MTSAEKAAAKRAAMDAVKALGEGPTADDISASISATVRGFAMRTAAREAMIKTIEQDAQRRYWAGLEKRLQGVLDERAAARAMATPAVSLVKVPS